MPTNRWTREELILALNLYYKLPFGRMHQRNPEIIGLSKIFGRTPSAVALKLVNFASLDPSLKARNIAGASHVSKSDKEIWNEFSNNWERLGFESEKLISEKTGKKIEEVAEIEVADLPKRGKEREALVKTRVNQNFFRKAVLAAYGLKCCITGLAIPELLNASHIVPWSKDADNRLNPRNGLCLNAFHDRAFDRGFLTITSEYIVKVSPFVRKDGKDISAKDFLLKFDGQPIQLPERFAPELEFIKYHNKHIYRRE